LGQALTLEDEPTLVRAVKAVKRAMARDKYIRLAYFNVLTSLFANILVFICWITSQTRMGITFAFLVLGLARIGISRNIGNILTGIHSILFGLFLGLPISSLEIPYHPILLKLYNPAMQSFLQLLGITLLFGILFRDVTIIISLKLEQRRKLKLEEEKRQEKLRGIFYTPVKQKKKVDGKVGERGLSLWNESSMDEGGRHNKSGSKFGSS
jgi:hypothetical protein